MADNGFFGNANFSHTETFLPTKRRLLTSRAKQEKLPDNVQQDFIFAMHISSNPNLVTQCISYVDNILQLAAYNCHMTQIMKGMSS